MRSRTMIQLLRMQLGLKDLLSAMLVILGMIGPVLKNRVQHKAVVF